MKITVVGTGYVGLVTGACFADMGNDVWCVDIDKNKIENLKKGIIPIYEPGLEEIVKRNHEEGRLNFTTAIEEGLDQSLFAFIAVGTPPGEDGSADLQYVLKVAEEIGCNMKHYTIVINKSTVPVGTAEKVREKINEVLAERKDTELEFDIVSNPEFLKEGDAVDDFMRPERVIVGCDNVRTGELMKELYAAFTRSEERFYTMDIPSAELTKYAANCMLATRISFMNEISHICEATGANIEMIRRGIGSDSRIGRSFLYAGIGYGGSCFPKDVKALIRTSRQLGMESKILNAVEEINQEQRVLFAKKVADYYKGDLKGRKFAVWGLAFKPQTDDMREAPSVDIITALHALGASFVAYDPIAAENAKELLPDTNIEYVHNNYECLKDADALIIMTEWHHFRKPDFERMKSLLKEPVIFDGRNQYNNISMKERGFTYISVGR
ncbi:MAG: UDP-glucose/GDP-mannose dehydrogenase family protein [Spirochaetes bacterium]|jgi:UDPglucose 6-dehydrogenase|nr:UDP-glucose/GDP-mannose dehydrogenase family protein [Spirochaetota bacterium]